MPILNPQYAFLEADFHNPNLTRIEEVRNQSDQMVNPKTTPKIVPSTIYTKIYWSTYWLITIPVDIYCAAILVIAEVLR